MKKLTICLIFTVFLASFPISIYAQTINEAETGLCDSLTYALINSLSEPIDQALTDIYKEDKQAPEDLTWAPYDTEIVKIKQLYGVGGA